jgi:hypothetical protein
LRLAIFVGRKGEACHSYSLINIRGARGGLFDQSGPFTFIVQYHLIAANAGSF